LKSLEEREKEREEKKRRVCDAFFLHTYKALYIECIGTYEKKLMDKWWNHLFLLSIIPLCYSQGVPLTQPTLTSITPINSTALNVSWQFASSIYDQSNLIQIYIDFYEFYFNYGPINTSIIYTFTSNKTITNLVENFDLVNAYYYVCFSSNSTNTNTTEFLFISTCQLVRTCLRSNSSACPQNGFVVISSSSITSSSFIITVDWLQNLLYTPISTTVQLASTGVTGTALAVTQNSTYINLPYQFSNLQSQTNYTVNIIVNYTLFNTIMSNTIVYSVTTSRSSNLFNTGDILIFVPWSVLLSFLFS